MSSSWDYYEERRRQEEDDDWEEDKRRRDEEYELRRNEGAYDEGEVLDFDTAIFNIFLRIFERIFK